MTPAAGGAAVQPAERVVAPGHGRDVDVLATLLVGLVGGLVGGGVAIAVWTVATRRPRGAPSAS